MKNVIFHNEIEFILGCQCLQAKFTMAAFQFNYLLYYPNYFKNTIKGDIYMLCTKFLLVSLQNSILFCVETSGFLKNNVTRRVE